MEELERRPIRKKRDKSLGEHIADEPRFPTAVYLRKLMKGKGKKTNPLRRLRGAERNENLHGENLIIFCAPSIDSLNQTRNLHKFH
jgi:hypothetical protein